MSVYRTANIHDLEGVLDWAADEGWNPGVSDAEAFLSADPAGFFIVKDGGETIAAISVVNHSDSFAFLGLYLVRSDKRGQGIGCRLWQHALQHAGGRTVGLDGVEAQQANYATSGFVHAGTTTRFSGAVTPESCAVLRLADARDVDALIAMEASASGARKESYLRAWFENTVHRQTFVLGETGQPRAFCTVRRCRVGAKIGPLLAPDTATAAQLMRHAANAFEGQQIIDVPQSAEGLARLCDDFGLTSGFRTARMYRGPFEQPRRDLFAVATLELG